jgi:two-component system cell cycle sensor histidine kinase/response regulator CckA
VISQIEQSGVKVKPPTNVFSNSVGKILVVDDEPELKNILVTVLTAQGFEVIGCNSGHQALAELRQKEFDLLLTDLMMPEMDGIALLEAALKIDPNVIGIIMTGQGTIQTAVDAMKMGAFDYVLKPFRLQNVLPVLTRAINTRRLRMENLQLRETVAIYGLCQTISFTLDVQTVLSKLADAALQQSDADEVSILLPTSDGKDLFVAAVRGEKRERLLGERVPLQESISSWVARERTPLILNGEVKDERFVALWPRTDIRSAVSVPMQVANKLVGIINLNVTNRLRPFTLGQMKALTILASTAAAALESASLYTQVRMTEEKYRSIFENATEGLFQTTAEGRLLTANPALARILGYASPEETIATITDLAQHLYVVPEDRIEAARLQEEGGSLAGFEMEAYRKNREKIWLSVNRRAVRNQAGELLYFEGSVQDVTERKQAEKELRESEERYRDLVENAHDLIYTHDLAGNYTSTNKAVERITGYSFEETQNLNLKDTVIPEHLEKAQQMLNQKLAGGRVTAYDLEIIAKDGHHVTVEVNSRLVLKDGLPVGVQGIARDITERKRAEAALRESEARKRAILESAMDCIITMDHEGLIVDWNPAAEKTFGYTSAEAIGQEMAPMIIPQRLREQHRHGLARYLSTGIAKVIGQRLELSAAHRDGTEFPIELTITKIESTGAPLFTGYLRDITERKRAENRLSAQYTVTLALAESNTIDEGASKILQAICESLDWEYGSLWTVDRSPNVLRCSQVWQALGAAADEFEAVSRGSVFAPGAGLPGRVWNDSKAVWIADVVEDPNFPRSITAAKVGLHSACAFPIRFHSETVGVVEFLSRSIREPDPDVLAMMVTIGSQIGQFLGRKRVEDALRESEEQLRQSQKLEAIGQLAGGVAHDFNNLLTAINGYSSLALRRLGEDHPVSAYLVEIKGAGDRAANLTRQLLAFGRKQLLQPLAINLNDIVGDMIKLLKRLIGEDVQLITKPSANLKQIKADPGQLEQVLVNLVVNARDAMPRGGTVTIETANIKLDGAYASTHVGVIPGDYVMLAISDTGTGIDHDTQSRIFEPFFTTKEKGKGTGLGLSTVYGIIRQSGGNIWVYSELGKGTTFKVYLPQVEEDVTEREDPKDYAVMQRGSETVLLVEDEDMVRRLASALLAESGYVVLEANGGEQAISLCKEHKEPIDLLITDVVMPKISGKEVAEQLQRIHPETKVLFMSGYTDEAIVHHGIVDSNIAFIQKPFSERALAQKIREVLESPNGTQ